MNLAMFAASVTRVYLIGQCRRLYVVMSCSIVPAACASGETRYLAVTVRIRRVTPTSSDGDRDVGVAVDGGGAGGSGQASTSSPSPTPKDADQVMARHDVTADESDRS